VPANERAPVPSSILHVRGHCELPLLPGRWTLPLSPSKRYKALRREQR
jgi:hypothetical protein